MRKELLFLILFPIVAYSQGISVRSINTISTTDDPRDAFIVDLDGDGDQDVVAAIFQWNDIKWYKNDGSQNFSEIQIDTNIKYVNEVVVADFNSDGDMDIVAVGQGSPWEIAYYDNNGSESFTKSVIDNLEAATYIVSLDVEGDGDIDIVVTARNSGKMVWYANDGNSNFGVANEIITGITYIGSPRYGDLDNDGDLDLIVSDAGTWDNGCSCRTGNRETFLFLNDGVGSFSQSTIDNGNSLQAIDISDIDGDGYEDILNVSYTEDKVSWMLNNGDGTFGNHIIITSSLDGAGSGRAVDLDNDGDIDILVAGAIANKIVLFENDGNQNFTEKTLATSFGGPQGLRTGDIDGDGDLDFIAGSRTQDFIKWIELENNDPEISKVQISLDNSTVSVTFTELVYGGTAQSNSTIDVNDFTLSMSGGQATLSQSTPSTINISGSTINLGIPLTGTPDGNEILTILPASNSSIYSISGNPVSTSQSSNTTKLIPNIINENLILYLDASNPSSYPGTGTVWYDLSGNENNFNLNGPTHNLSGYFDFDGNNDFAKTVSTLDLSQFDNVTVQINHLTENNNKTEITFEHSENWNTNIGGFGLANQDGGGGYINNLHHSNHDRGGIYRNYEANILNDWHQQTNIFSSVDDPSGRLTYLDGNLLNYSVQPSGSYPTGTITSNSLNFGNYHFYIGSRAGSTHFFNGKVKSILIYVSKLSSNQVSQNYFALNDIPPTDISLTSNTISETASIGSLIGTLSATDSDTSINNLSFSFESSGDTQDDDNGSFTISGTSLLVSTTLDYETKTSYNIYVKVSDGTNDFAKAFTVSVTDINEAPTDIALSLISAEIPENVSVGTSVGTFSSADPETEDSHSYSFVSGIGDTDNTSFTISGTSLLTASVLNYQTQNSYAVRIQTSDGTATYSKTFTISISDSQVPRAKSSNVYRNSTATLYSSFLNGNIVWQESTDGTNWTNISSGTSVETSLSSSSTTFSFTGSEQNWVVPAGVTYINVDGYGAKGGNSGGLGGLGGRVEAKLLTIPGEDLKIYIGGLGSGNGGFNGGGGGPSASGRGGGATDIRQNGNSLANRIFVAGGGGGGGQNYGHSTGCAGGAGGGLIGGNGIRCGNGGTGGIGGSQTAGGANGGELGVGGAGSHAAQTSASGAGGGGFYGGGGGSLRRYKNGGGGGGGSSYTNSTATDVFHTRGYAGANGNGSLTITTPTGITSTYTSTSLTNNIYYRAVINGVTTSAVTITIVDAPPTDILLNSNIISETASIGSFIGSLSATDADSSIESLTFTFTTGNGTNDADNGSFTISGTSLLTSTTLDYETKTSYNIYVKVSDGTNDFAKAFTVSVTNVNEAPSDLGFSGLFNLEYLIVAGGGGGGYRHGAGGGAGGLLTGTFSVSSSKTFDVTVGQGGAGGNGSTYSGSNGANSELLADGITTLIAIGGGGGTSYDRSSDPGTGSDGGSGGGAAYKNNSNVSGGSATPGQGHNGGNIISSSGYYNHAGGGGAGGPGGDGTSTRRGDGGAGIESSITGTATYYAGGGGGGSHNPVPSSGGGAGGQGGGGAGGTAGQRSPGVSGTPNTGGGGGGASTTTSGSSSGGAGGSGIVVLRYLGTPKATGGTITQSGGYTIHSFTDVGTNNFTITEGGTVTTTANVDEGSAVGTLVSNLTATDSDTTSFTFSLVQGDGTNDRNNSSFTISGTQLLVNSTIDYETTSSLNFYVQASDGSNTFSKALTVNVNDVNEPPVITATTLSNDNGSINVTFSEPVYISADASNTLPLEVSDFALSISGGTATLSSTTPSSISANGNTYTLGLPISGAINGSETVTVVPIIDSIYDSGAATASTTQSNNTVSLHGDTDSDGVNDVLDQCPNTPGGASVDVNGCAESQKDPDNDGITGINDNCPSTANADQADTDGDGMGDACDPDIDDDGIANSSDNCPYDYNPDQANNDNDSSGDICDSDDDNDGYSDIQDFFPFDPNEWLDTDRDGIGNNADTDDDNDNYLDTDDAFPLNPREWLDTDGDGIGNNKDKDDDNDGVEDKKDAFPLDDTENLDTDKDGIGNNADEDDDGDGYSDLDEITCNTDPLKRSSRPEDYDRDLNPDCIDTDDDNDGCLDQEDLFPLNERECKDTDGDGIGDNADLDADNDGVFDPLDDFPLNPNESKDTDGDGIGDNADLDDNNDGFPEDPITNSAGEQVIPIFVSELLTPNQPGEESTWRIVNIDKYPSANVKVYSPSGMIVFESWNYQNDWNGTNKDGKTLPTGPYFYRIDRGNETTVEEGWLYIFN